MKYVLKVIPSFIMVILLTACGAIIENGSLKIKEDGRDIVSIGRDGFKLDGNITGLTLDENGLDIQYPNGSIAWDKEGFIITHTDGSIRVADGKMTIADQGGKTKTLDTAGQGAEYATEGGVLVKTGKKAAVPKAYPSDKVPLINGFVLNASAELGSVLVVSGYVPDGTVEDATAFYQKLLMAGESYSHEKKGSGSVLKAKLSGTVVTIYLVKSLTADAVNVSIVIGK